MNSTRSLTTPTRSLQGQIHWQTLIEHVSAFNLPRPSASGPGIKGIALVAVMAREISRQAAMPAFDDLLWFIGWITLAILPLLFIVKMSRTKAIVIA